MRSRKLLDEITIERKAETGKTQAGARADTYTAIATVRAELLRRSLNERLAAFGEAEESTMGFRLYAVPGVDIATGDRVTWAGKFLNIVDVQEIQRGRVRALEIICRQVTK